MTLLAVRDAGRGVDVADRVRVADTWWLRFRGLLGQPPLGAGEGLLIQPCKAVHMYGMRYPIDVVFLDGESRVAGVCHRLEPGTRSPYFRNARSALELEPGLAARTGIAEGDLLTLSPLEQPA